MNYQLIEFVQFYKIINVDVIYVISKLFPGASLYNMYNLSTKSIEMRVPKSYVFFVLRSFDYNQFLLKCWSNFVEVDDVNSKLVDYFIFSLHDQVVFARTRESLLIPIQIMQLVTDQNWFNVNLLM